MSELDSDEIKRAFDEILKELKEAGRSALGLKSDAKALSNLQKSLSQLDVDITKNRSSMGGLFKEMISGRKVLKDLSGTLADLDHEIENLAGSSDKIEIALRAELVARRASTQATIQHNVAQRAAIAGITKFTKSLSGTALGAVQSTMNGLQSGSSAFSVAGGVMTAAVDIAGTGVNVMGTAASQVGASLTNNLNPAVAAGGAALELFGVATTALATETAAAAKFAINFLSKEGDIAIQSYHKMSSAGAMFTDGLEGMQAASFNAGLTVQHMSEIVSSNSTKIAQSGMGIGETVKYIGTIGQAIQSAGLQGKFIKLGYGIQDYVALTADVISDLHRSNSQIINDPQKVAQVTMEYAKNLRVISDLTGEDGRKKMDEVRAATADVAVQAKMLEYENKFPGMYEKIQNSMGSMSDAQKRAITDTLNYGSVVDQNTAVLMANSPAMRQFVQQTMQSIQDGTLDTSKNQLLQAETAVGYRKEIGISATLSRSGADMASLLAKENQHAVNMGRDSAKTAIDTVEAVSKANGKLTEGVVTATVAVEKLAVTLQNDVYDRLDTFATLTDKVLDTVQHALDKYDGVNGTKGSSGKAGKAGVDWSHVLGAASTGSMMSAGAGALAGGIPTLGMGAAPGALLGGMTGAVVFGGTDLISQLMRDNTSDGQTHGGTLHGGKIVPTQSPQMMKVLDAIASVESPGYDYKVGEKQGKNSEILTDKTLAEIHAMQLSMPKQGFLSSAVGRYQFTTDTLTETVKRLGYSMDTKFSPAVQDALAADLVRRNIDKSSSASGAADAMAGTWAGLRNKNNVGAYDGVNGNSAGNLPFSTMRDLISHVPTDDKYANGGITKGASIAGEAGPEAVIPLPNGRAIPLNINMGELLSKLDELLSVMKDHHSTTEKLLWATA